MQKQLQAADQGACSLPAELSRQHSCCSAEQDLCKHGLGLISEIAVRSS